ncbi:HEAT repeat domain-containing protein [Thalassoroseus pseudoceratinae]|uniref:HEAT repeat domain-containing protein n=1 Tax=Thalassoroseus pseudoceratinae TaxID=2713176 RepID=UPI0014230A3B|nr:HEAT repeat domain-containing protein [Thalassoroseus pseudoceratinae]
MSRSEHCVIRLPWPNFWAWFGALSIGFAVWSICFLETEAEKLEVMFDVNATLTDRVRAAEQWVERGSQGVPRLREALKNDDLRTRAFAAYALSRMGKVASPAVPELVTCVADASAKVRGNALFALARIEGATPQVTTHALNLLTDEYATVRQTSVDILVQSVPMPVAEIMAMAHHENDDVRFAVLDILQSQVAENDNVRKLFQQQIADEDENVRIMAYGSLLKHRFLSQNDLILALDDPSSEIVRDIIRNNWSRCPNPELAASKMMSALERFSCDARLVIQLLRSISQCGGAAEQYSDEIARWTKHRQPSIRTAALSALASTVADESELLPVLGDLSEDSKTQVAFHAGVVASQTGVESQRSLQKTLEERLEDSQHPARPSTVATLAGLSGSEHFQATSLLIDTASDSNTEVRYWAIRGLGRLQRFTPEVRTTFQARLSDPSETEHNQTEIFVAVREHGQPASMMIPDILNCWKANQKSSSLQLEMIRTLTALAPKDSQTSHVLFDVLESSRSAHVRTQALQMLSELDLSQSQLLDLYEHGLSDPRSEVRAHTCGLLATSKLETDLIIGQLITSLNDKDALVRLMACCALEERGPSGEAAISHLIATANDRSNLSGWRDDLLHRVDPQIVRQWQLNRFTTVSQAAKTALETITGSSLKTL